MTNKNSRGVENDITTSEGNSILLQYLHIENKKVA